MVLDVRPSRGSRPEGAAGWMERNAENSLQLVATRRLEGSLRVLVALAATRGRVTNAQEIAATSGLDVVAVRQLMRVLERARFITSKSGPAGGYRMAEDPASITVMAVLDAVEGRLELGYCKLRGVECPSSGICALHLPWERGAGALRASLESLTISDLIGNFGAPGAA